MTTKHDATPMEDLTHGSFYAMCHTLGCYWSTQKDGLTREEAHQAADDHNLASFGNEESMRRYPSDSDADEQAAKKVVLVTFPEAQENPYDEPFCRPGLVFAPFCGGWCKIGENWQEAKNACTA